ncbi:MAG: FGGY family carbohydrate kinase, partial [Eudoraea sp.]
MQTYILAFDQGTTSCRALIFDKKGSIISTSQREFTQYFPKPGWVEHDAMEILYTQVAMAAETVTKKGLEAKNIA